MKNISAEVFIFCLWANWMHFITCSKIEFRDLHYRSRYALDKICEIYTFDRCSQGWSLQKSFLTCGDTKKRIEEQLNYLWNMCPKSFSWANNKRKLFSDGRSRGPLLARAALNAGKRCIESDIVLLRFFWLHNLSYRSWKMYLKQIA